MSIRQKVLIGVLITFAVLFLIIYLVAQRLIVDSFNRLETQSILNNVERARNALADESAALGATARDWGYWDDTYAYVKGEYPEYPETNFSFAPDALVNLGNQFIIITDMTGDILVSQTVDFNSGEFTALPAGADDYARQIATVIRDGDSLNNINGLHRLPGNRLTIVASRAVLPNSLEGPPLGTLTFGRFIDEEKAAALSESLRLSIRITPFEEMPLPNALADGATTATEVIDDALIAGYGVMADVDGSPAALITVEQPRTIYAQGQDVIRLLALILLATGIVVTTVMFFVVEFMITSRVTTLALAVDQIEASGVVTQKVAASGSDEIAVLGQNINSLLVRLGESQQALEQKNRDLEVAYQAAQESTRLKSEFLSTMSHELRTPLNAIIGYSELMIEGITGGLDDESRRMTTNIRDSGNHLLNLVNDILDLSKIEAGRMEIVYGEYDMHHLVGEVRSQMRVLADEKQVVFDVNVDGNVPHVLWGDRARLKQVLINLLSNAFKFTHKGAVGLYISTDDSNRIIIRVRDTGIGIPPHALSYIFEKFRQVDATSKRSYGGTGLGLAITRSLVEAMDGEIRVESRIDEGSVFTVLLPLKPVPNPKSVLI